MVLLMNSLVTGPLPVKATEQLFFNFRLVRFPSEKRVSFLSGTVTTCLPLRYEITKWFSVLSLIDLSSLYREKEQEKEKIKFKSSNFPPCYILD